MLKKKGYSKSKYSWMYALIMVGAIVLLSIIAFQLGLRQEIYVKILYIPILFLGIISFTRDIVFNSNKKIKFNKLLFYSMRTGVFTCVFLYPLIMLFLIYFYSEGGIIKMRDSVAGDAGDLSVLFTLELEIFIVILLSSLAASGLYLNRQEKVT
ncbi:hypothetical protein [Nonlabens antarcticus]|uniref:hypothetical protein n=1 Tax=Nonlabens antarcticus TaxID=392714 RepID=UPI0018919652|nr:hypothetical protein [Nonlabens antarcticus]